MIDPQLFDKLAKNLADIIPDTVKDTRQDIDANIQLGLQTALKKMNLVSREEFDVQTAVLQRTREKLHALEKQLEELEK